MRRDQATSILAILTVFGLVVAAVGLWFLLIELVPGETEEQTRGPAFSLALLLLGIGITAWARGMRGVLRRF